jgi:O-antigen/teichoic acid export membrane protein
MSKQRVASNLLAMGIGQGATFVFTLLLFVVISRYLGPTRFGELTLAKAIVMVAWLGVTLGMETLITRTVARSPERAGNVASAAMIARGLLAIPMFAAVYLYAHIAHLSAETSTAAGAYALAQAIWALERVLLSTFQGREHMALLAKWSIMRNILSLSLIIGVRLLHGGVVAIAATQIPVEVVLFGVTLFWMKSFGQLTWRVSLSELREVTQGSLAFWANEVFFTIYLYLDSVILAGLVGATAVGLYAPATQMLSAAMFFTVIIGPATLPQLSRLGMVKGAEFRRASQRVLSLFILCGVPLTIGAFTFSGPVILAVFGHNYHASVVAAMAISLCILPMFLNFQFSQILAASDRQWQWTLALAGCCVVNPPLNFVLISLAQHHWHNAALGAALAWLATELLEVMYGLVILRDLVFDRTVARVLLGALVAGTAQGAMLWITASIWSPVGEVLGVITFGVVAIAIGAMPRGDATLLIQAVTQRLRGNRGSHLIAEVD